jgi:coproporphyrinogen III oxidase
MEFRDKVKASFQEAQGIICAALESQDGKGKFSVEPWEHQSGGGGITRIIVHGDVLEKGGVNFSAVEGAVPDFMNAQVNPDATRFFATGISIVMHPYSPMVPITHMNVRYFETDAGDAWFGGGIDLTPIYVIDEEASEFHRGLKEVCDRFHPSFYDRFKHWADDYFFNEHREETRGVGGIFYDYIKPDAEISREMMLAFSLAQTTYFASFYAQFMARHQHEVYTEEQKQWQLIRRGRYVEFNLVYDRGTKFGLVTKGRIESILMSLPEVASWHYQHQPAAGSPEWNTLQKLKKGINWIGQ